MNLDTTVSEYWKARIISHLSDTYMGVPMLKLPEDLATYEHIMHEAKINVVVELGTGCGGSAMWFRDRLLNLSLAKHIDDYGVITLDRVDRTEEWRNWHRIQRLYGDVEDPKTRDAVLNSYIGGRVMVVEDSAHTYATTSAALDLYSPLVSVGSYFVVEDTYIDIPELRVEGLSDNQARLHGAIADFLVDNDQFEPQDSAYGITTNPGGWLKRVR